MTMQPIKTEVCECGHDQPMHVFNSFTIALCLLGGFVGIASGLGQLGHLQFVDYLWYGIQQITFFAITGAIIGAVIDSLLFKQHCRYIDHTHYCDCKKYSPILVNSSG